MPKVSFILPAYKRRFLHEAIASILAQTYRDFELVVVDDCSPEDLKSVVDEFHDERLTYHRNSENIGGKDLVAAWNHAMEYARGEWCVLASDDDVYLPQFLEELMKLHEKYPQCDLLQGREVVIDADGKWLRVAPMRIECYSQIQMLDIRSARRYDQFAAEFCFCIKAWKEIGGFVEFPCAIYTDDATWLLLAKHGVACSSKPLMLFRASGVNVSLRWDNYLSKITAHEKFRKWITDFVGQLNASNCEEQVILKSLLDRIESATEGMERYEMSHIADFKTWWKVLRCLEVPSCVKRRLFYERFPRVGRLRSLLRF